ncbi:DUF236 repeat domain-containing protein [Ditylenchus destructor]|uniref:DUF236 repeat domain-containing protein n=1 Tax=Ditylenchus destructor TaxID=166010 RepID=A0AAD4R8Q5_9BILA|nr:DUF236 repeat domain-containing protein [Ditylenchus destructor]
MHIVFKLLMGSCADILLNLIVTLATILSFAAGCCKRAKGKEKGRKCKKHGNKKAKTPKELMSTEPRQLLKGGAPGAGSPFADANQPKPPAQGGMAGTHDPNYQTLAGVNPNVFGGDKAAGAAQPNADGPPPPAVGGMAGTADPNYQTLAALGKNEHVFGEDKAAGAAGPNPPQQGGLAGTADPNYQTLAGIGGDVFGADKAAGQKQGAADEHKAPQQGGVAGTADPNYQTLAGIGGDVFGANKATNGNPGDPKAPQKGGAAAVHDPNYQTLAGIGGDVFGADKKGKADPKAPQKAGAAGAHDPNYQTLAGIGGDVFGADKKGKADPKAPQKGGAAGSHDPNYQTLAGIGGDSKSPSSERSQSPSALNNTKARLQQIPQHESQIFFEEENEEPSFSDVINEENLLNKLHFQRDAEREGARAQQKRQAQHMLEGSAKRFPPIPVGQTVRVPVPVFDRAKTDPRNLLGVVMAADDGFYSIGTGAGILKEKYTRNQIEPSSSQFVSKESVPDKEISLRTAVGADSLSGGQGYGRLCNSRCHNSTSCKNK